MNLHVILRLPLVIRKQRLRYWKDNVISLTELNRRSSVANLKVNASKNRYERVIPFDANRVNIDPTENHSSGLAYINASFITAEANPPDQTVSRFIATQGPLPTTYEDFWKMVLQYHCPAVVMLTRLVDPPEDDMGNGDIMCGDYFQGENGVRIIGGNIHTVTRKFIKTNSSLELRHLEVNYAESHDPPRPVLHIFFPDWPDNGAPRETLAVREIYRRLNNMPSSQVPVVVHCSAGVGRTGTYCVIHNTLQRILVGDMTALELYETVTTFKSQRRGMVQSEEQYIFCFKAIIEELEELVPSLKNA
ncbi:protein-tyrosine-phosphatase PTP1 [Tanacetum coccineum]